MKQRVLTAIVLAPIVLGALILVNPWPLTIVAAIAAYICGREISGLLKHDSYVAGAVAAVAVVFLSVYPVSGIALSVLFTVGVGAAWTGSRYLVPISVLWAVAPLAAILQLHGIFPMAMNFKPSLALLAIVPLWGGDTAAIFAGKAFGKHPLAPKISPKKTWEGAIANFLACVLVGWALGLWIETSLIISIGSGAIAGIFGQAGDLFESYVKRKADVKDSGSILPGHGGLMDRVDSVLFTAPLVYLLVSLLPS